MANIKKTIQLKVEGDTKDAKKAMTALDSTIEKTTKSITSAGVAFGTFLGNKANELVNSANSAIVSFASGINELSTGFTEGQQKIQRSLGITSEEAGVLNESVKDIWRDGFGDVEQATGVVTQLKRQFEDLNGTALEDTAKQVLAISNTFEQDFNKTIDSSVALVDVFGMSNQEALDMLASGLQNINPALADDFLDTISEYAPMFEEAGFSAEQMYSIIETGTATGVLGTDKIADAMKEFKIRMIDGSDATNEALTNLFAYTDGSAEALNKLNTELDDLEGYSDAAKNNIEALEDQFETNQEEVEKLQNALDSLNGTLEDLADPTYVKGVADIDRQMADLELQSKKIKLAMKGMVPDSAEWLEAEASIDRINEQLDTLGLQRDINYEEYRRTLETAAGLNAQPAVELSDALNYISATQGRIAEVATTIEGLQATMQDNQADIAFWTQELANSEARMAAIRDTIATLPQPAQELLNALRDGSMSVADALPQVLEMLNSIEDPIKRSEIGVALFGTAFEDMGADAILAIDMTRTSMENMAGTAQNVTQQSVTQSQAMTSAFREIQLALVPVADEFNNLIATYLVPMIQQYAPQLAQWIGANLPTAIQATITGLQAMKPVFDAIVSVIGLFKVGFDASIAVINVFLSLGVNLQAMLQGVITPATAAKNVFNDIATAVRAAITAVGELITKFAGLKPPEWLSKAGSGTKKILGFASGGTPPIGTPSVVGEKGEELIVPRGNVSVIPNNKLQTNASPSNSISVVVNVSGDAPKDIGQIVSKEIRKTVDELYKRV